MSTENNLLLQSAHLRSTKSYKSTANPYDIDAELAIDNELRKEKENVPEKDGFFKTNCSATVIAASIATIVIMIIIFILLISYH